MSESNNNVPMRITQLEEATAYEDGMYYAVAKAGSGTKKIASGIETPVTLKKVSKTGVQEVNELNTTFFEIGSNRLDKSKMTDGVIINNMTDGTSENANYTTSDFCYVGDLETIKFMRLNAAGTAYITDSIYYKLYDENRSPLTYREIASSVDISEATWIRISISPNYKNTFMIVDNGLTVTDFVPFSYSLTYLDGINDILKRVELQLLPSELSAYTFGKYYGHGSTGTNTSTTSCILTNPIRLNKGVKYTYNHLYAYFCNIKYDSSSSVNALSNDTTNDLSGSFIAEDDGYIYITLASSTTAFSYDSQLIQNYLKTAEDNSNITIEINPTDEDIIQILLDNEGANIHFNDGDYDIISIYEDHFGNDYFTTYTGYSSGGNNLGAGLPVYRNTKMTFSTGAKFTAHYTGTNTAVRQNFACFWLQSGVTFDGLRIEASGIRNIIHDDFDNAYAATTTIKNCHFEHDYIIIAGGLANHDTVIIENNYFGSTDATHDFDFSYHNYASAGAQSNLIIKDNYCEKGISIRYYGASTLKTDVLITNNSYAHDVEYRPENSSATIDNMTLKKWNNELRS